MLYRIKISLVESIYTRQSVYLRYLLKNIFKLEYECSDFDLIETIIDISLIPRIFSRENYFNSESTLEEILKIPLQMKNAGEILLPEKYTTSYPYNWNSAWEEISNFIIPRSNLMIHENFYIWFSGLIQMNNSSIEVLMHGEGTIPIPWRYYIAIMAVSTIRSHYLLQKLKEAFLLKGGEEEWLIYGLSHVPEKIQKLSRINNLLAHQPWKITAKDINEIFASKNGWNRDEFVHSALIMVNYHRIAAIVEALKINFAEDPNKLNKLNSSFSVEKEGKMNLYNNLLEMNEEDQEKEGIKTGTTSVNTNPEDVKKINRKNSGDDVNLTIGNTSETANSLQENEFDLHISDYCTLYLDFDFYSDIPISNMNFNWNDEGLYILKNICLKGVEALNNEITFISELTSNTIGGDFEKLNTFHFRNSIRCYIEKIFGIVNEDYDYSKTNKLLLKSTKTFIKNIACLPEKISKSDFPVLLNTFSIEEIFHLIIVVSANKARAELTFLSYVIYDIMKSVE